ncbi:hypothetical protein [Trueperella sp. LYQ143]|uniref:hypothetical protein n=1 Tax=unclassified Trueperella TaxID=2630174 RepID=UPI0039832913
MPVNLAALLSRVAPPVTSSVAMGWPQIRDPSTDAAFAAMDEYASYGVPMQIGGYTLRQSTPYTCGAMVVLLARYLCDTDFRQHLDANPHRIAEYEVEIFDQIRRNQQGIRLWPRRWGSPPWLLAQTMSNILAQCSDSPDGKQTRVCYWDRPVAPHTELGHTIVDWILHATCCGYPIPLYTGGDLRSGVRAAIPRHVVLALPGAGTTPEGIPEIAIYDPASGKIYRVPIYALADRETPLAAFGHWTHIVWAVLANQHDKELMQ